MLVCCAKFNGLVQCITARSTAYFTASLPTEFLVGTPINLVRVTMLQASPHSIQFNSVFDFGEKQAGILPGIPASRLAPTIAISLNAASYMPSKLRRRSLLLDQTKIVSIQDSCKEFRMLRFEERSCVRCGENRIGKIKQSTRSPRGIVPRRINKARRLC